MNRRLLATNIFIIIKYLLHIKPYIRTQGKHERCFYFQLFMSEKTVPYHIYLQAFWLLHLLHHRPTTQLSSSNLLHMLLYSFFSSIFTQTNWRVHYHHHQEKDAQRTHLITSNIDTNTTPGWARGSCRLILSKSKCVGSNWFYYFFASLFFIEQGSGISIVESCSKSAMNF